MYAGIVAKDRPFTQLQLNMANALNLQIAAAFGYAVLWPSMPLNPPGETDDPLLKLGDGVLPAIDKVVADGLVDPGRVFVAGHSFGGFAACGLITQNDRFKAAISLAGITDLTSLYGSLFGPIRYTELAHEHLFHFTWSESGQGRMGRPPWEDAGRYLRSSPIFYVDRVQTPVMLIHGDLDQVPMDESEAFFMSLNRQGKRAELVRYWGEGHVLQSPANVRDMWARIIAWLDEFGDIARDSGGVMVFAGDRAGSRKGAPPLQPGELSAFGPFARQ